jgi:hypothetical protein
MISVFLWFTTGGAMMAMFGGVVPVHALPSGQYVMKEFGQPNKGKGSVGYC